MKTSFNQLLNTIGEYGVVYQVSHPIVMIEGLPKVKSHEVILFENEQKGEVYAINRGKVEARVFSREPVKVGTKVVRTNQLLSIPVGPELLGQNINPLGETFDETTPFKPPKELRELDIKPIGISGRRKITSQMATGIALIDMLVPLGKGQRELVIGDRKTGKTSLLMTMIKKQVNEGAVAIYTAIGKKKSEIKKIKEFLVQENLFKRMVLVATSSYDSPSLIFHTPYAAMTIAEYFRDQGIHSLIIMDDLSTHAKYFRELSLLARRFPGRDSYPGDVFYIHSRLLERAGNFIHPKVKEVSITCLPIVEIIEGDFTGYISTNLMGITDGHIYLDSNIYFQGMRPAVNVPLSVTRVGRQTMGRLPREVHKILMAFITRYDKLQNLSHFGQELTDDVKRALNMGDLIYKFFKQPYEIAIPINVQLIIISMIFNKIIDNKQSLDWVKKGLMEAYNDPAKEKILSGIVNTNDIDIFNDNILKNKEVLINIVEQQVGRAYKT
jgi:F-type H+-transporting ATPase subunit alpha